MKTKINIFLLVGFLNTAVCGYDGLLKEYYIKTTFNESSFREYEKKLGVSRIPSDSLQFMTQPDDRNFLSRNYDDRRNISSFALMHKNQEPYFSFKTSATGREHLGFFYVAGLDAEFPPFFRIYGNASNQLAKGFKSLDSPPFHGCQTVGDIRVRLFNQARVSVIELYDASVSFEDLSHISRFEYLEVLGLPCRGMKFKGDFVFPPKLETLVVRNAELNEPFFRAINGIPDLKRLSIINCRTSIAYPQEIEFGYVKNKSWADLPKIFDGIDNSLEVLEIINSDPRIFDYAIPREWKQLKCVKTDIFFNLTGIRTLMASSDGFRNTFPVLEKFSLSVSPGYFNAVQELGSSLSEKLKLVKLNIIKYPVFIETEINLNKYELQESDQIKE